MITKRIFLYKKAILSLLIAFSYLSSWSQIENKVWHLYEEVKVDFNDTPSTVSYGHNYFSNEGIATVTDEMGNVIFTATDIAIYDTNEEVIVNGNGIEGSPTGSSAQSPIVLQNPASPTEYYIFYIADHADDATEGGFKYSILESCTEKNNLAIGEIKNVQIPGNYSERLNIVEINKGKYWILTTEIFQNKLYAFKVDENGIDTNPVVSNLGGGEDKQIGKLKINNSKNTLAWSTTFGNSAGVRLMDFDISTGKVDNPRTIYSGSGYGLVWSPNDEFLYFTDIYIGSEVVSFNIASNDLKVLDNKPGNYKFGDLAMSPSEDAILVSNLDEKSLDRITNINEGGDFEHNYLSFGSNIERLETGLQNQVMHYPISSYEKPELDLNSVYIIGIKSESINLIVNDQFNDVSWSDGQIGNTASFLEEGIYTVEAYYNCCLVEAEFEIIIEQVFTPECDQIFDGSNLEDNLLLHYTLDGNTLDSGPDMIHGVNNGGEINTDRFGDQSSYSFDGNSNVLIPHDDSYKVQFPISVSTWVKWESDAPNKNGVFNTNFEQNNYYGVFMLRLANSGKLFFGYGTGTGGITLQNRRAIISETETELDKWHHIAGIINGPNDFHLFIDGCEETFSYTGDENPTIAYNDNNGFLGKLDNSNIAISNDLIGAIDDFYFWNRIISEEEIFYLYDRFEVPEIELEETYTILNGQDDITIDLPIDYTDVLWSDGQTGNTGNFSNEGTYQVEAFYDCHLVCEEFQVEKEIIFEQTCDQVFDGSKLTDSLIFYHNFDGDGIDQSSNGLDAVIMNSGLAEDRFMQDGESMIFEKNTTISIPSNQQLKVDYPFSFSLWAYFESNDQFDNALFNNNFTQDNYHGIGGFRNLNGEVSLFVGNGSGSTGPNNRKNIVSQNAGVDINEWTHIVFVMSGPADGFIYVNGCLMETEYVGNGSWDIAYNNDPFVFGTFDTNTSPEIEDHKLLGKLDDFYFWNRSITEEEVLYLYDRFEVQELELQDVYIIPNGQNNITIEISSEYTDVIWSDGQIGNTGNFSSEGTFQVESFYNCHLVCKEFEVKKEIIEFEQECDQIFDNSNLENNLLLHYDLDGNTLDSGPNMIHGINNGGEINSDRFGDQSAYSFDGSSNIIIPHDDSYKVQFPISVSTWVKWESDSPQKNGVFSTNFEQDNYHGVFMLRLANSGKLFLGYGTGTGGITLQNRRAIISETETELDKWYHIAGIINGPNDFRLYVDGCEVAFSFTGDENPTIAYNENNGFLGKLDNSNDVPSNDLIGAIDDFYFWNRTISEEEIFYLYDRFEVPEIELEETYTILNGQDDITIDLPIDYTDVLWSDGQTGNSGNFTSEGAYQVEAFYQCHLVCGEFNVENEIVVPPIDSCDVVQSFNSHCGTSKYHCVISDEFGNSKYYFEGQILLPEDYSICETDLNDAISSVQNIYVFELIQTGQTVDFRAFATILDFDVFVSDGLILDINICNGMEQGCISYVLPYGTCSNDYDCTIDYKGISFRNNESVNVNYCMVLHDISNDDCSSEYTIEGYLMTSSSEKLVFEKTVTEDLENYKCISVPLSNVDFLSNNYNCIELRITDNCTGNSCFRYDCNLFNSQQNLTGELSGNGYLEEDNVSISSRNETFDLSISPFPNPTKSQISFYVQEGNSNFELRTCHGELIEVAFSKESNFVTLDMNLLTNGVYFLSRKIDNKVTTQRIIKID